MKVINYSINVGKRKVTIVVNEELAEETILYLTNNEIWYLGDIDTKYKKKGKKAIIKIEISCSNSEKFSRLHEILRKDIEI